MLPPCWVWGIQGGEIRGGLYEEREEMGDGGLWVTHVQCLLGSSPQVDSVGPKPSMDVLLILPY